MAPDIDRACLAHASPVPGANDAAALVEFSSDLDQLLRAIGRMLRRSGKNRKRLDELAKAYCGKGKVGLSSSIVAMTSSELV